MKHCTRCVTDKPETEFGSDRSRPDGLYPYCRVCARRFHKDRRDVFLGMQVVIRIKRKRCAKCGHAKSVKEFSPASKGTTRDGMHPYCKKCTAALTRARHKRNPQPRRDNAKKRKALKQGATVEPVSTRKVWERDGGKCYICGRKVKFEKMHLEHVVPLSRGGKHSYANCRTACSGCNLSKGAKTPEEYNCGSVRIS